MTTLVSSIMPHMTVTKAGKEVASKNGPCVLLSYLGRKSYPETLQQNSPQISLVRTRSLAEGNRITLIGFIPWEKVFTTLTNQRITLARKKGLLHMVSGCFTLEGNKKLM